MWLLYTCTMVLGVVRFLMVVCLASLFLATKPLLAQQQNWLAWRGPHATGVAPDANPPITWSETKNIRFKQEDNGGRQYHWANIAKI